MAWKKTALVCAIVVSGMFASPAARTLTDEGQGGCWSEYFNDAVDIYRTFESCVTSTWWISAGPEICVAIYIEQAEFALLKFLACVFGMEG